MSALGHDWPLPDAEDWRTQAACRGVEPAVFYPAKVDTITRARALAYCQSCAVVDACLADALATPPEFDHGIRGGLSRKQRLAITRRPRPPAVCGTRSGYMRHRKDGTDACQECREANTAYGSSRSGTR